MQKDTALVDSLQCINALIHLITTVDDELKLSYCKLIVIPQLTQMGIEVKDTTVEGVLSAMFLYKSNDCNC